jgi:prophage antirepressor-like protein
MSNDNHKLSWAAWDTPERIEAHPDIRNGVGSDMACLMAVPFENGSLKITATRRPQTMLHLSAKIANTHGTWITGALVSHPGPGLVRIRDSLLNRLKMAGYLHLGKGVLKAVPMEVLLDGLRQLRPNMEEPKQAKWASREAMKPEPEPEIPAFLKKEKEVNLEMNPEQTSGAGLAAFLLMDTPVRQDAEGRYCLNDLQKAGGGHACHRPASWLQQSGTQVWLEGLVTANPSLEPVRTMVEEGGRQLSFACQEVAVAYAKWAGPLLYSEFQSAIQNDVEQVVEEPKSDNGAVTQFSFESLPVRIVTDENGEPWFVAKDVCNVLGYANSRKTITDHCRTRGVTTRDTLTAGGVQPLTFINEGNLYRLVIKSQKPEAEKFESWVCDDVLPALRKTGSYAMPGAEGGAGRDRISGYHDVIELAMEERVWRLADEQRQNLLGLMGPDAEEEVWSIAFKIKQSLAKQMQRHFAAMRVHPLSRLLGLIAVWTPAGVRLH